MKKVRCYVAVLVGLGVFAICSSAQALVFSVSDISFPTISGNNDPPGYQWSVSANTNFSLPDLAVGNFHTFTYGTFFTDAFPININEAGDNDDYFSVNFYVSPPTLPTLLNRDGFPDATYVQSELGSAIVDFDNTLIDRYFDVTGHYTIQFLDVPEFTSDGFRNLQATLTYLTAPTTNGGVPVPMPEPSTIVLLSSGLLGLFYVGRKRNRK